MSRKYRAEQVISISGSECGTEIELKMVVTFTVHPGSPQTQIDPAENPSVEVDEVRFFNDQKHEVLMESSIGLAFQQSDGFSAWLMAEASEQEEVARDEAADARRERRSERDF